MFNAKTLLITLFVISFHSGLKAQTVDVEIGDNNIPIEEVQFEFGGSTVTQTAGVTATNTSTTNSVDLNYFKINNGSSTTILYPNNFGTTVSNNNFTGSVGGVGIHSNGNFIDADDPNTFEPALEDMVNNVDLMEFLYYDGTSNLPSGDDFDIYFAKGIEGSDFIVVGERNGNTYFTITPLDAFGTQITGSSKVRFGQVAGTASGNGTDRYDWDIGYSPSNYTDQSMVYTAIEASLFGIGSNAIYGFRIDNNGEADVKFFGLSDDAFSDNPNNPEMGGIIGNVYNDADGLMDNLVDGTGIDDPGSTALYAILYNSSTNLVLANQAVATDGTYEFLDLDNGSNYAVGISTTQGVVGNTVPASNLPSGWMHTGEKQGTGTGDDGNPNGITSAITVNNKLVTNINFGIESLPDASAHTSAISNPLLGSFLTIGDGAAPDLTGSDIEDGTYGTNDEFEITALPQNGDELYYDGNLITLGQDGTNPVSTSNPFVIASYDPSLLEFKFTNSASTDIQFSYRTIDAADETSAPVVYRHTFAAVTSRELAGNVFDDADGLVDSTVDGSAIDEPDGVQLYSTLYDADSDTTISSIPVANDGSFLFNTLPIFSNYGVVISRTQGTTGAAPPATTLPTDWVYTGENVGTAAGNDGTVNGEQNSISLVAANASNVNFGINKIPEAAAHLSAIADPYLDSFLTVGAGTAPDISGTDLEDGASGTGDDFEITALPQNGDELWYNGVRIINGDDGLNPVSAANPFTITNYDPAELEFRFTNLSSTDIQFSYRVVDAANFNSSTEVYRHTFSSVQTRSLSGNVFDDADGLVDNTVDGVGIDDPETEQLYATLYDNGDNKVFQSIPVQSDGSFTFSNLASYNNYGVLISTNQGSIGNNAPAIAIPTDWVLTGDFQGTGVGNDGTIDGNQAGLSVTGGNLTNVNFGINKIPDADAYSFGIADPIPGSYYTIGTGATSDLSGSDLEDGTLGTGSSFGITSLPTSNNQLYYNGVEITLGVDGINPPSAANPFVIGTYDPSLLQIRYSGDSNQTSTSFNYLSIDAAGFAGAEETYTLSYSALPVEWASFDVEKIKTSAMIRFSTASEKNNSHFFVQKSLDGNKFRNIGTIAGKGFSTTLNRYEFRDPVLNIGENYYRIAQIDFDGKVDYTEIKSVTFDERNTTSAYPNPISAANGSLAVKYYSGLENETVRITNMLGVEVMRFEISNPAGWNQTQLNIQGLVPGTYALRIGDKQKAVLFAVQE